MYRADDLEDALYKFEQLKEKESALTLGSEEDISKAEKREEENIKREKLKSAAANFKNSLAVPSSSSK